jgi:hypothetical protein
LTVTNPYYEFDPNFTPFTKARAGDNNIQFQSLQNAFDLLPGDSDALTTDTAIFAPESGSGNSYIVTMPDTRTSNQDGDGVRFFATHTNTGSASLNIDGIGALALVNWTGTVLGGGEIVSGRLYEIRYDATNVQYVISASTEGAIQVGYAEEWAIKAEDVPVSTAAGGNGTTDFSAFHWAQKALATAVSGRVLTDINTATPPTTEGVTGAHEIWDADQTDILQRLGFEGSNTLVLKNFMHGGGFLVAIEDDTGTEQTLIETADLGGGDTFWTEVEASADMEGSDGATSYTEVSLNLAVATFEGGAELDTAQFQSGTSSLFLDRSLDSFISFPDIPAFDFGTGDWTLEGYARLASLPAVGSSNDPGYCMVSIWDDGLVEQIRLEIIRDVFGTRLSLSGDGWGELGTISGGVALNTWFHWAITRTGGTINAYWNGNQETSDFGAAATDMGGSAAPLRIGQSDGIGRTDFFDGWIDDVRLTIGTARYTGTGSITPDSTPFPTSGPSTGFKVGNSTIQTIIRGSGGDAAQTITAALGGLEVNNTLTGVGMERVLTDSDISSGGAAVVAQYRFDNATAEADPGNGDFRMDNATPASVTELFISSTTDNNNDFDNMLGFLSAGDQIYIQQDDDATKFILFDVTANVDNTGWYSVAGTVNASGTIFGNNAKCHILLLFGGTGGGGSGSLTAPVIALADINTATPPAAEAVTGAYEIWDADETDLLGRLGYFASNDLVLSNRMHGGEVRLTGEGTGGTLRTFFVGDPNSVTDISAVTSLRLLVNAGAANAIQAIGSGAVQTYYNDIKRFATAAGGVAVLYADGNTDAEVRQIHFSHQDGTVRGRIGHEASDILTIRNEDHLGEINIVQEDGTGADVIAFSYDASSGQVELNAANVVRLGFTNGEQAFRAQVNSFADVAHNNTVVLRTTTSALGGVTVSNLLTGGGLERVLTESDLPGLQVAVKKADTSRDTTTTLADDPDLAITVDGTAYYAVTIHGHVTCAAAGIDMKYALDGATGRIIQALFTYAPETSTIGGVAIFGESTDQGNGGTMDLDGVFQYSFTYTGYVYFSTGGAGARTIEFTWAQNISNATAVVLKEGSWMTVQKVGDF